MKTIKLAFDGERLRKKRRDKDMSQEVLAEAVGVTRVCLSNWEKGVTQPSLDHVGKLGAALGVSGTFFIKEG